MATLEQEQTAAKQERELNRKTVEYFQAVRGMFGLLGIDLVPAAENDPHLPVKDDTLQQSDIYFCIGPRETDRFLTVEIAPDGSAFFHIRKVVGSSSGKDYKLQYADDDESTKASVRNITRTFTAHATISSWGPYSYRNKEGKDFTRENTEERLRFKLDVPSMSTVLLNDRIVAGLEFSFGPSPASGPVNLIDRNNNCIPLVSPTVPGPA